MRSRIADGETHLLLWQRVREFAVPPSMIAAATARRIAGDWAAACAAAHVDVDLNLRVVARALGTDLAARIRADLRHLAPDLLRWHMPRVLPDGLLRPGLTVLLASYDSDGQAAPGDYGGAGGATVHLVARTPPAWADAGQRISLALWDGTRPEDGSCVHAYRYQHPHPAPDQRFRLDLHRHLWDARRSDELWERSGAGRPAAHDDPRTAQDPEDVKSSLIGCAVHTWPAEAAILLRAEGRDHGAVSVRLSTRRRMVLDVDTRRGADTPAPRLSAARAPGDVADLPILPDAATWVLPDLELLRTGLIDAERLHPLVASALVREHAATFAEPARTPRPVAGRDDPRLVECQGETHRLGLVDGVLVPLDHDPDEIRREELLVALGGPPMPCMQVIDREHRNPGCLIDVASRLAHGDAAGALAAVEDLLGPDALLRAGALRDELEAAANRRVVHGLYRAGLTGAVPARVGQAHRNHGRANRIRPGRTSVR